MEEREIELRDEEPPEPDSGYPGSPSLILLKLHGSMNWRSSDGQNCLVIGRNKSELIQRERFLRRSFEYFERVLRDSKHLVVVGYGFGDPHINDVIADGVRYAGLRLSYIAPGKREKLRALAYSSSGMKSSSGLGFSDASMMVRAQLL